jgi:hypothetical protein
MSPLEDDFTPDPDPLPIDGNVTTLDRQAETADKIETVTCPGCKGGGFSCSSNFYEIGRTYDNICDYCAGLGIVPAEWVNTSFDSLLELPANGVQGWCETHGQYYTPGKGCLMCEIEKEAGVDRIRQAREVETNLRAELEAQRQAERKAGVL